MHIDNADKVKEQYKYAGFGDRLNQAFDQKLATCNEPKLQLPLHEKFGSDSVSYFVETGLKENKGYYNGFSAAIINNLPPTTIGGVNTAELELRLSSPPDPTQATAGNMQAFKEAEHKYREDIGADMKKIADNNPEFFNKLMAFYNPTLPFELSDKQREKIEKVAEQQVRRQWFPASDRITMTEAYNLLADTRHRRSVYKTYFDDNNQTYGTWVRLNFDKKTEHGNYVKEPFHDNYGYNPEAKAADFALVGLETPEGRKAFVDLLKKGHLVEMHPVLNTRFDSVYVFAEPEKKTYGILDSDGKPLSHHQFKTPEAQERQPQQQQQTGRRSFVGMPRQGKATTGAAAQGEEKSTGEPAKEPGEDSDRNAKQSPRQQFPEARQQHRPRNVGRNAGGKKGMSH